MENRKTPWGSESYDRWRNTSSLIRENGTSPNTALALVLHAQYFLLGQERSELETFKPGFKKQHICPLGQSVTDQTLERKSLANSCPTFWVNQTLPIVWDPGKCRCKFVRFPFFGFVYMLWAEMFLSSFAFLVGTRVSWYKQIFSGEWGFL